MSSLPLTQFTDRPLGRRERHAVALTGLVARHDGSTVAVRLTDLSYDGCGVETSAELTIGERIELSVVGRGVIAAHVRWCAHGRVGLVFEAAPSAPKQLPRRTERLPVAADVTMRRSGQTTYRVRMFDLSLHGCSVEVVDRPSVDELVWIKVDGLEALEATVCWVAGQKAGLKYVNGIHPAVFAMLMTKIGGATAS